MFEKKTQQSKERKLRMREAAQTKMADKAAANAEDVTKKRKRSDPSTDEQPPKKSKAEEIEKGKLRKPVILFDADKAPVARMKKFKLFPNKEQRQRLNKAFGVATWTYNQCLAGVKTEKVKESVQAFRDYALNSKADLVKDKPWVTEVPYDIRFGAADDLVRALKANRTKIRKGDLCAAKATFKFQSKYRKSKKIVIGAVHWWAAGVFYPSFFGKEPFKCREKLPDRLPYDSNLTLNWLGEVHLYVPQPLDKHTDCVPAPLPVVAIDPGVRTFGTLFDPSSNRYVEWGKDDMGRIYRLAHYMDDLQARMRSPHKPVGHRKRWRMKRAWRRMSKRVQNLVKDFHFKYAKWLCVNYRVILLPHYDTRNMVRRGLRRISSKSVRALTTWSPCMFRDRLIGTSRRYPDCHVIQISEAYTSKTCRCCGFIHRALGGNKTFDCPSCKVSYGRDEGGASNIFMRYMTRLREQRTWADEDDSAMIID